MNMSILQEIDTSTLEKLLHISKDEITKELQSRKPIDTNDCFIETSPSEIYFIKVIGIEDDIFDIEYIEVDKLAGMVTLDYATYELGDFHDSTKISAEEYKATFDMVQARDIVYNEHNKRIIDYVTKETQNIYKT